MNRIQQLFKNKKGSIISVFFTAGFPKISDTPAIAKYLEEAGANLIEIGIPFSDPIADGPVIQESNKMALTNGMTLKILLDQVRELRQQVTLPVILMGYLNPVLQYGMENFCRDAASAGADGLILPDMPMDVYETEYKALFNKYGLINTFLISPTTSEKRIRHMDESTAGFLYAVSASSTTGAKNEFNTDQIGYFARLRSMKLKNSFLIGFGISNAATFSKACEYGAGAIIGSAFISMLKKSTDLREDINKFVKGLREA